MSLLAVTVLGHDRPGIIADVTDVLAGLRGNLEDSSMTLLRGHFAMTLVVRTPATAQDVHAALAPTFSGDGLDVAIIELRDEAAAPSDGVAYVLSVHGADRAGIVSAITKVIASYGGNVTDLTTRLSGALYVLVAEVEVPRAADVTTLQGQLKHVAAELGVEATLREAESDLL